MSSPWAIPQHGVDIGGYAGPPSPVGGGASSPGGASSKSKRSLANWFSRSRSTSPSAGPGAGSNDSAARSRQASPTSFVVRSVVKQPGGVSYESSGPPSPGSGVDEASRADYMNMQHGYSRQRSQPLNSLSVPAGGPGGGTGYGTATSPNDGRPLSQQQQQHDEAPSSSGNGTGATRGRSIHRPPSPGAISAGAFRGRSGSNSRGSPLPSPSPIAAISPGPQSWRQAAEAREAGRVSDSFARISSTSPGGPRQSPFRPPTSPASRTGAGAGGGGGGGASAEVQAAHRHHHDAMRARIAQAGGALPLPLGPGSDSNPRSMSSSSVGPPPVIPLEGIPSPIAVPIDVPVRPHSYDPSPLGSVSPGGGFGIGGAFAGGGGGGDDYPSNGGSPASATASPARWIKGLFSKSPSMARVDQSQYAMRDGLSPASSAPYPGQPVSSLGQPNHYQQPGHQQQRAYAWTDGSPLAGARARPNDDEAEALERKRNSMRLAARIEDEHRNRLISGGGSTPNKPWSPRQAIESDDDEDAAPPKSRSPPGRKPVPRLDDDEQPRQPTADELRRMSLGQRERVAQGVDPDDRLSRADVASLTPAQQWVAIPSPRLTRTES